MTNDVHTLSFLFDKAKINYILECEEKGWFRRLRVKGDDRCFVFDEEGNFCGIRSLDDNTSFDGRD